MAVNKVNYGNTTLIDLTDTTAIASDVAQGKYFYTNAGVRTEGTASGGGGGVDLSWLASSSPTPSVRNFFYALANGTAEHGEFTTGTITNTLTTFFTMTSFSNANPPQGIIIIDKNFYQGATIPTTGTEAISIVWLDKSFINPASSASNDLKYVGFKQQLNQTGTAIGNNVQTAFIVFDNNTASFRTKWYMDGHNFQLRHDYNNNLTYTLLYPSRTYIWIAY